MFDDLKFAALLQLAGFLVEWPFFALTQKRRYPWKEAFLSLVIAVPAFFVWGWEIDLMGKASAALAPYRVLSWNQNGALALALSLAAAELHFYLTHRLEHRISWMWADHRVHHSSKDLTIFDGNRLGWTLILAGGFNTLFLPLVLLGFDGSRLIAFSSSILLWQFFIHTQTIPRLGFLDFIFNTPSNHRVHHASNKEYLDRNFGGVTVLFDHLLGTFARESKAFKLHYGLVNEPDKGIVQLVSGGWMKMMRASRRNGFLRGCFGPPLAEPSAAEPMKKAA